MSQQHPAVQIPAARRTRTRLGAGLAVATLAFGGLVLGPTSPALAHDQLVSTEVVTDAAGAIDAIRLSFNNNIMEVGTEFVVTDAAGEDATGGDLPEVAGHDVTQQLTDDLAAGEYAGSWRVVSSDGHPIDGAFTLNVAADGAAELSEAGVIEEEHEHEHEENAASAEATAATTDASETPTSFYVFLGVGGLLVIAVVVAAFVARSRRLAQMQRDAQSSSDTQ